MVRRNTLSAPARSTFDLTARTRLRAEPLEPRDTPSAAGTEEVLSLPQLPGMSSRYPIDVQPPAPTAKAPLLQQARGRYAVGTNGGGVARVNVYDAPTGALLGIINPFGRGWTGGTTVATGDVTGDGVEDVVVGAGRGRQPTVKVFDGVTLREVLSFDAYQSRFRGGLSVAVGDVDGDRRADIITGAGVGSQSHIRVFSGRQLLPSPTPAAVPLTETPKPVRSFLAFNDGYRGGVNVAAGDVNGDGKADIVVGKANGRADVVVIDGATNGKVMFRIPSVAATSGATVAAGDVDGDGKAEVITGTAANNQSTVRVYDAGGKQVASHAAFVGNGGVNVGVEDLDGDGKVEILAGSGLNTPRGVKVLNAATGQVRRQFPAVMPWFRNGLSVG